MELGDLRERVVIQQNTLTADTQGGRSSSWGTLAEAWANVLPKSGGGERLQTMAVTSRQGYRVVLHYRADVTAAMRVRWTPFRASTTKTLEILNVSPFEGGRTFLQLDCAEVV